MISVHMYSIYNDLLIKPKDETTIKMNLRIQKARDLCIRQAMVAEQFPNFPMSESEALDIFPFFKEITSMNPMLNILLIYKKDGEEVNYVIVHNNNTYMYSTRQEAISFITKSSDVKYGFIKCPV